MWGDTLASISSRSQPYFLPPHMSGDLLTWLTNLDMFRFSQNLNSSLGKVRCHRIWKSNQRCVSPERSQSQVPDWGGCDWQVSPSDPFSPAWRKPIGIKINESYGDLFRGKITYKFCSLNSKLLVTHLTIDLDMLVDACLPRSAFSWRGFLNECFITTSSLFRN